MMDIDAPRVDIATARNGAARRRVEPTNVAPPSSSTAVEHGGAPATLLPAPMAFAFTPLIIPVDSAVVPSANVTKAVADRIAKARARMARDMRMVRSKVAVETQVAERMVRKAERAAERAAERETHVAEREAQAAEARKVGSEYDGAMPAGIAS